MTDARVDRQRTLQLTSHDFDRARATATMKTLVEEALSELAAAGLRRTVRGHPRPGDALSRPELRAGGAGAVRRLRRRHHAETLAGLPRRARGALRLRHPRRDHRDRQLHGDGGVGDAEAGLHEDRQGRRRRDSRGIAPRRVRGRRSRHAGVRPRRAARRPSVIRARRHRGGRLGHAAAAGPDAISRWLRQSSHRRPDAK